jgi:tRNA A37 threonylcarbamoyladenosine dehydratase
MDATKRQSLREKVPYKRFTTVDNVPSDNTVCLKLAEEIVLQCGVGGVAYHVFESLERTNT